MMLLALLFDGSIHIALITCYTWKLHILIRRWNISMIDILFAGTLFLTFLVFHLLLLLYCKIALLNVLIALYSSCSMIVFRLYRRTLLLLFWLCLNFIAFLWISELSLHYETYIFSRSPPSSSSPRFLPILLTNIESGANGLPVKFNFPTLNKSFTYRITYSSSFY